MGVRISEKANRESRIFADRSLVAIPIQDTNEVAAADQDGHLSLAYLDRARLVTEQVTNGTGSLLAAGKLVCFSGWSAGNGSPTLTLADKDTGVAADGFILADIANGSQGVAITQGLLTGQNTSGAVAGQVVYLGVAGGWQLTSPATGLVQPIGTVLNVDASAGVIYFATTATSVAGPAYEAPIVDTIADLVAISSAEVIVDVLGHTTKFDGGGGRFALLGTGANPADIGSGGDHDGGWHVVTPAGWIYGRIYALWNIPQHWGAFPVATMAAAAADSDKSSLIQRWANFAMDQSSFAGWSYRNGHDRILAASVLSDGHYRCNSSIYLDARGVSPLHTGLNTAAYGDHYGAPPVICIGRIYTPYSQSLPDGAWNLRTARGSGNRYFYLRCARDLSANTAWWSTKEIPVTPFYKNGRRPWAAATLFHKGQVIAYQHADNRWEAYEVLETGTTSGSSAVIAALRNDGTEDSWTFTAADVNTGNDTISVTGHALTKDDRVRFTTGTTLPAPLVASATYYVLSVAGNLITLSATVDGTLLNLTSTGGAGNHTIYGSQPTAVDGTCKLKALGRITDVYENDFNDIVIDQSREDVGVQVDKLNHTELHVDAEGYFSACSLIARGDKDGQIGWGEVDVKSAIYCQNAIQIGQYNADRIVQDTTARLALGGLKVGARVQQYTADGGFYDFIYDGGGESNPANWTPDATSWRNDQNWAQELKLRVESCVPRINGTGASADKFTAGIVITNHGDISASTLGLQIERCVAEPLDNSLAVHSWHIVNLSAINVEASLRCDIIHLSSPVFEDVRLNPNASESSIPELMAPGNNLYKADVSGDHLPAWTYNRSRLAGRGSLLLGPPYTHDANQSVTVDFSRDLVFSAGDKIYYRGISAFRYNVTDERPYSLTELVTDTSDFRCSYDPAAEVLNVKVNDPIGMWVDLTGNHQGLAHVKIYPKVPYGRLPYMTMHIRCFDDQGNMINVQDFTTNKWIFPVSSGRRPSGGVFGVSGGGGITFARVGSSTSNYDHEIIYFDPLVARAWVGLSSLNLRGLTYELFGCPHGRLYTGVGEFSPLSHQLLVDALPEKGVYRRDTRVHLRGSSGAYRLHLAADHKYVAVKGEKDVFTQADGDWAFSGTNGSADIWEWDAGGASWVQIDSGRWYCLPSDWVQDNATRVLTYTDGDTTPSVRDTDGSLASDIYLVPLSSDAQLYSLDDMPLGHVVRLHIDTSTYLTTLHHEEVGYTPNIRLHNANDYTPGVGFATLTLLRLDNDRLIQLAPAMEY